MALFPLLHGQCFCSVQPQYTQYRRVHMYLMCERKREYTDELGWLVNMVYSSVIYRMNMIRRCDCFYMDYLTTH